MDLLLLGIYAFFVWLIFIKFKWLPWTATSQVIVVIIPVLALATMSLLLNVFAPYHRCARHQVRGQRRAAGARARDRGACCAQPAGEEG